MKIRGILGQNSYNKTFKYWEWAFSKARFLEVDKDGLNLATPEPIALHRAKKIFVNSSGKISLDLFCGIGSDTIALSRYFEKVISVDSNRNRLDMAKSNARLYGVDNKIEFINIDSYKFLDSTPKADIIFIDPNWGEYYWEKTVYRLSDIPISFYKLFKKSKRITKHIVLKLPKNIDIDSLKKLGDCEIENVFYNDKLSFISVYYGLSNKTRFSRINFYGPKQ